MRDQITQKMLERKVETLNKLMGQVPEPYTREENGGFSSNIGTFYISQAYGGVSLERITNNSGACSTTLNTGHITKRDLAGRIDALILGIQLGMELNK